MCKKDCNLGLINKINTIIASILVGAAIIGIITFICVGAFKFETAPKLQSVKIELEADSTFTISYDDKMDIIEGLEDIMQNHESLLENKYQYIIEKRSIEDSLLNTGSVFIGIILAILAFFGFKNFQSIEEDAKATKEAAEKAAEKAAEITAEKTAEKTEKKLEAVATTTTTEYLRDNLKPMVDKHITEEYLINFGNIAIDKVKENINNIVAEYATDKRVEELVVNKINDELTNIVDKVTFAINNPHNEDHKIVDGSPINTEPDIFNE